MRSFFARAPGRVSLSGGGSDLPAYYERHGGAVLSLALATYTTAEISEYPPGLDLVSRDHGVRETIPADRVRRRMRVPYLAPEFVTVQKAVAWHLGIERARLALASDLPAGGGLGGSAAACVALVSAAAAFAGDDMSALDIAAAAARVELNVLRRPCGKQDHYVSALGGVNVIEFFRDGSVVVAPVAMAPDAVRRLSERLMLFSNGGRRNAASPLAELVRRLDDPRTLNALAELKELARAAKTLLERGDVGGIGELLHRSWVAKKALHSQVTTPQIDRVYGVAREAGATGGKLCGAGLGGALLLHCPPARQADLRLALTALGWRPRPFGIDWSGVSRPEARPSEISL